MARPELHDEDVQLRPLRFADAGALNRVLRDRRATRYLPPRVRQETGRQFVARVLQEQRQGEGVAFAIVRSESDAVVGQIRLMNWSRAERSAEVGFWLRRTDWGRGYGTSALRLACRYGFRSMNLHRIEALVVEGNIGSRRILAKVGFRLEGTERHGARVNQRWVDVWRLGLLRGELRQT